VSVGARGRGSGEAGGWLTGKCTVAIVDVETLEVEIREL